MSVRRVMGTETEFAVSPARGARYDPVRLSSEVVRAAADSSAAHIRWDYRQEDPVNDARGHRVARADAPREMLTDVPQRTITNTIAANGGRIYIDHAHPEYSAPETMDPFEALAYDRAGEAIMRRAQERAGDRCGSGIRLYKNNVDGKGASWGSHENYMMLRDVPFDEVAALMTLHLVTRQIFIGSGRVGLGERSESSGFQLSQRADYIHAPIGLQTTFDRPIVNTRDEPHSTDEYRRLHVITADANRMDVPQALKLGTTSMLLWMLERSGPSGTALARLLDEVELEDPVEAMHVISHDLTLGREVALRAGGHATAWQIQVRLLEAVFETAASSFGTDSRGEPQWPDAPTARIMRMWRTALGDVARVRHADDTQRLGMEQEASRLEWLLKWQLLERLRRRGAGSWRDPRLAEADIRWAALDHSSCVFDRLSERAVSLCDESDMLRACGQAPPDTRAWLRSELVHRFAPQVVAFSWTHITVGDPGSERGLFTCDMSDPTGFTRDECADAIARCDGETMTVADLLRTITHGR